MRAELAELRAEVARVTGPGAVAAPAPAGAPGPGELPAPVTTGGTGAALPAPQAVTAGVPADLAASVAVLQAVTAEQAQTKVESSSRLPVKLFGTIHAGLFTNTGEANWLDLPNLVAARAAGEPTGSTSMSLRQTRLGLSLDGLVAAGARWNGLVAFDFFGGIPAFQTGPVMGLPRLLYAFARGDWGQTSVEVGQDEMVLAPRNPTSLAALAFPALFRSGNLYLRVPQVRVEQRIATGDVGQLAVTGAVVAPISGDFTSALYAFVPPALTGERSRWPAAQGRLAWRRRPAGTGLAWDLGLSGHYGRERNGAGSREVSAVAVDADLAIGRVGLAGEWFSGENLDAFGGALGQARRSHGGFAEVRLTAWPGLDLVAGGGTDRLPHAERSGAALSRNLTWFGNAIYRFTPELSTSVEYRWLETRTTAGATRRNQHVDWVVAVSF